MAERDLENGGRTIETSTAAYHGTQHQDVATTEVEVKYQTGWEIVCECLREYKVHKQPHLRPIGEYGIVFICIIISFRFVAAMVSLGAVAFIAYLYDYWSGDNLARVDVLFPSFFPLLIGFLLDAFEIFSLLWIKGRRHAINPVAIGFDIALIGAGIFSFLIINMADDEPGMVFENPESRHSVWALDMRNAMIFMIVFSLLHATFILFAAAGVIHVWVSSERTRKSKKLARIQAEMVKFTERNRHAPVLTGPSAPAPVFRAPQRTVLE
ncbi:hypothetical protein QBC35DRAFT_416398 [Podospora australis]|uniref:Uncharacterized protein n=1 Tax=Podospora australis TaxID=1536484 RepID=A0AAN7AFH9_9PEZI|nr:hypothetical protein QBC35DRAFT_416398 [Podospora australis]